jgi:hypothetical protein
MRCILFCLALGLLLSGCGGGGGGATNAFPLATTTRMSQNGNTWNYSLTGVGTVNGHTEAVTGSVTSIISQYVINGQTVFSRTTQISSLIGGSPYSSTTTAYFVQDSTGEVFEVGDTGGPGNSVRILNAPVPVTVGAWSLSTSQSQSGTFTNGDTFQSVFAVQGTEVVTTPIGTFTTWKTTNLESLTSNGTTTNSNTTQWFAPEMGAYVKLYGTATVTNGSQVGTLTITATLTSTNVPVQ